MELKIAKHISSEESEDYDADKPRGSRGARRAKQQRRAASKHGKACSECGQPMIKLMGSTPDGLDYVYMKCSGCGEEVASRDQLHMIAAKSRALKTYSAKITRWGQSLGIRIPKELATLHNITHNEEVTIVPEEGGFRVVPARKG